jgi:tetratricopeptide (TPR) repeat protein
LSLSATLTSWDAFDEAERLQRLALDVQTKVYGPKSPEVAHVWKRLANLSHTRKRYGEALGFLKTAREIYEQQTPRDPERLFGVVYSMGVTSYQRAEFEQAGALLQEAVNMLPQLPEHVRIRMDAEFYLGRVLRKRGQYDAARRHLRAMLEQDERAPRPSQWSLTRDLYELAAVARSRGERAEAEQLLARSEAALRNVPRTETVTGMWGRLAYERAMLAESDGKAKKAEQLFREAVEKGGQDPQTDAVMLVEFLDAYASALRKRGKGDEAAQVEQRARQLLASVGK